MRVICKGRVHQAMVDKGNSSMRRLVIRVRDKDRIDDIVFPELTKDDIKLIYDATDPKNIQRKPSEDGYDSV